MSDSPDGSRCEKQPGRSCQTIMDCRFPEEAHPSVPIVSLCWSPNGYIFVQERDRWAQQSASLCAATIWGADPGNQS